MKTGSVTISIANCLFRIFLWPRVTHKAFWNDKSMP